MDIIDSKYIGLVSSRLEKFKRVKPNLYNFRCPICGDSQKHKNKARGYFTNTKQILILNVTTVVHLPLLIILLKELTQHFINSM